MRAQMLAEAPLEPLGHGLGRVDLEQLDAFLKSDRSQPGSMMLSELDGFLTGLAVGPELVRPSEWLPLVWGGAAPALAFTGVDAPTAPVGLVTGRYKEILREVADDALAPIFWKDSDDRIVAADWAEGFVQAIKLRMDAWRPLFTSRRGGRLLVPILWQCRGESGRSLLGLGPHTDDHLDEAAIALIPNSVKQIAAHWSRRGSRPNPMTIGLGFGGGPPRAAGKIGRNDPCPCGSGKKFKRCCGGVD